MLCHSFIKGWEWGSRAVYFQATFVIVDLIDRIENLAVTDPSEHICKAECKGWSKLSLSTRLVVPPNF